MRYLWIAVCYFLSGCLAVPDGIEPVDNFELNRYLGDWYEIARLDHSFECGLEAVKAEYSLRDDGGIRVINSGRDSKSQVAQQAEGRAYFVEEPNLGHLKVSFFGPFFGSYVIFELDENYQYAFIAGNSRDYLWLLARTPEVSEELIDQFISRASQLGFDTSQLIFVSH
ncbi:MAG: lipocalin family protein [Porticoccaceae bacterium]